MYVMLMLMLIILFFFFSLKCKYIIEYNQFVLLIDLYRRSNLETLYM